MLTAIELSKDEQIIECLSLLYDTSFLSRNGFPQNACSILSAAKLSVSETSNTAKTTLKSKVKQSIRKNHTEYWDNTLDHLQVQSKFKDIVVLEGASHIWNRMLSGLPAGQLSFLRRAGSDCLPTPMNLHQWQYRVSNSCPLCCSTNPTTAHIH